MDKAKLAGYVANPLPLGAFNLNGKAIPFHQYETVFAPNKDVVVVFRIQTTTYNGKRYVQLVPTKMRLIDVGTNEVEELEDIDV
ncbi:hypothetical protein HDV02_003004 [Globomyces sp. JEL0801]|nr:hypothetical protein HDV02_003004 [Globomyces sp. JEL0801]